MANFELHASDVEDAMRAHASADDAIILARFFKTTPGQYGAGDHFLGVRNPATRTVARDFRDLSCDETEILLSSPWHEVRLCALLIWVDQFTRGLTRADILRRYTANVAHINNWDLVDLSAPGIIGVDALTAGPSQIRRYADGQTLWHTRIAILATLTLIRHGHFDETIRLATQFERHPHDLIHKACGWMLREIGKRDRAVLHTYLAEHLSTMPRTTLRYAIEHEPPESRRAWLAGTLPSSFSSSLTPRSEHQTKRD